MRNDRIEVFVMRGAVGLTSLFRKRYRLLAPWASFPPSLLSFFHPLQNSMRGGFRLVGPTLQAPISIFSGLGPLRTSAHRAYSLR